ncbi:hypothetical protein [Mycolicibacterium sp. D5.8-2]|uniref:DUF7280 family protein n=1 Tax=Mycolicibacterium sp. D5.8-2 TaxID=3085903 RepID=UPI00298BEF97|nr:hypothetical protein [Mycolicibacterium sp. D5.8-2]MDW5610445.1 hypothetical protein [Mycolicibacterium sp. D5.8-2]
MSITTAIITTDCIAMIDQPVDCLLDAMIEAQNRVGQITWNDITGERADGTYRGPANTETPISVVDTSATTDLLTAVRTWLQQAR